MLSFKMLILPKKNRILPRKDRDGKAEFFLGVIKNIAITTSYSYFHFC